MMKDFMDAVLDVDSWRSIMQEIEEASQQVRSSNWTLPPEHPTATSINLLVPWEITRIQVSKLP